MAPSAPLPVVDVPEAEPEAEAEAPAPAPEPPPPAPRPAVVKPDPVEWPEPEPDRLDLRPVTPEPARSTEGADHDEVLVDLEAVAIDDAPDPPRFESTAEQPAIDVPGPASGPNDWTEWRGIRPLGPVDRPAGTDEA
jgi:hypothetical protein